MEVAAGFVHVASNLFAQGFDGRELDFIPQALQEEEFRLEKDGYDAVKHQRFVGTGYFDAVQNVVTSGKASTTALEHSTEAEQFHPAANGTSGTAGPTFAAD